MFGRYNINLSLFNEWLKNFPEVSIIGSYDLVQDMYHYSFTKSGKKATFKIIGNSFDRAIIMISEVHHDIPKAFYKKELEILEIISATVKDLANIDKETCKKLLRQ